MSQGRRKFGRSLPAGSPLQLTNYDDNISFVRWLGDGSGIIFGKAKGGDENTQFFWMKPDGTGVRVLTDEPAVRHNFAEVSSDGKTIVYSSNKRNRNFFDIYAMKIATGKEELQYQQDGNNDIVAINDSGTKFVVSHDGTELSLDNDLYLVNTRTKTPILLTPHTGAAEFGNVHFVADGIVFTHNDKREFTGLAQMRKINASGDDWSQKNLETKVLDSTNWDIGGVEMTTYGNVMAQPILAAAREVEPHRAVPAAVEERGGAGHERHVVAQRAGQQVGGVDVVGQGGPDEQPRLRGGPLRLAREVVGERVEHRVAAGAVDLGERVHVVAPVAALEVGLHHQLRERGGAEVRLPACRG